jgi:hypothetical protein
MGCASQQSNGKKSVAQLAKPAAALAFDSPVGLPLPADALARAPRDRAAFVGFDQTSVVYSYIQTEDRQILFDRFNHYDRRAFFTRICVSYR